MKLFLRKLFTHLGWRYQCLKTYILYKTRLNGIGKNTIIISPLILTGRYITIGAGVFIRNFARIQGVDDYRGVPYTPSIVIGDGVSVEQNFYLTCSGSINIGKHTAIAANVTITDIHHQYEDITMPPEWQPLTVTKVSIGEHSKIYNNAVILAGTQLGKHNIVSANSVVSGVFPDYCVLAGAPAMIIRKYDFETQSWR